MPACRRSFHLAEFSLGQAFSSEFQFLLEHRQHFPKLPRRDSLNEAPPFFPIRYRAELLRHRSSVRELYTPASRPELRRIRYSLSFASRALAAGREMSVLCQGARYGALCEVDGALLANEPKANTIVVEGLLMGGLKLEMLFNAPPQILVFGLA